MATILISGGTGLIGSALVNELLRRGHSVRVLSRSGSGVPKGATACLWNPSKGSMDASSVEGIDGVIHLAGAGVADKRWTEERKNLIIDSRVESARLIKQTLKKAGVAPRFFISASGSNYYGTTTTSHIFEEREAPGSDFLGACCRMWEEAAFLENSAGRVVALRTGVVFANGGGALDKLVLPIRLWAGSPLGSGKQYVPWIHIDDLVAMYVKAVEDDAMQGPYNAVAPGHITQAEQTRLIAKILKKPLWLPNVPAFVLRLMLGEMSSIVLEGSRLSSEKITKAGFTYRFSSAEEALRDLLSSP